ncbi:MAG TPA: ATP-binding protein [Nitrospiraceae bacterium]|nr:ATP-binding protein [Nitrospiraceae bacterium]
MPARKHRSGIGLESLITLLVFVIGILAGTVGLAYAYWYAKQSLYETVGTTFQELARQSSDKVALLLSKEVDWVQRLAALPEVHESVLEGFRLHLTDPPWRHWRNQQRPYFRSLAILDRDGRMTGGYTSEATRTHYSQQPWWPIVFDRRRSWVGTFRFDDDGQGYVEIIAPILDGENAAIGALKVVIATSPWFDLTHGVIGRTGHVMWLSDTGMVLACPLLEPVLHRIFVPGPSSKESKSLAAEGALGSTIEDTHGRSGGIIGIAPVLLPDDIVQAQHWTMLVSQDPNETFGPVRVLMWKLAGFWMGAVVLAVWLRWRLAKRIVRPLNELIRRIGTFGEGAAPRTCAESQLSGIREIDRLVADCDDLAERLRRTGGERQRHVAELEQLNQELRMSEEHYRLLWDHAVDAKILVTREGTILDVNRRAEMKFGTVGRDMIGQAAAVWFADEERARLGRILQEVFQSGEEQSAGEVQAMTMRGVNLTMEMDLTPVTGPRRVETVMLQLIDLTERKELEEQLLRTERLASLSQFASMFAHDIRNPLAGIKKTLEWLGQRPELRGEPQHTWLEDLRFTTDLLLGMIHDMLDVYQESYSGLPLTVSEISVMKLAQDVLHVFRAEAKARDVSVHLVMRGDEQIMVTVDSRRMQRVLINLVHNALKYSPAHGAITVSIHSETTDSRESGVESLGDGPRMACITVEDEGPGIESNDLPHIFDMFFRKKDGRDYRIGRGLGLHFCRLVVEAHHGVIRADNRSSGGARFTVELPVLQGEPCLSRW